MTIKPITPDEIAVAKVQAFPDEVIQVWNEIIAREYSSGSAVIKQNEIAEAIAAKLGFLPENFDTLEGQDRDRALALGRRKVFDLHYLDVEPYYAKYGWSVYYDDPAYNETYEAFFRFTRKTKTITDYGAGS